MKEETVLMILESLMAECSRRFSNEEKALKIRNWTVKLSELTDEQGMYGLEKALDMPLDFMPSVGKFKELCVTVSGASNIDSEASEAWALVMSHLNYYVSPVFKNGVIAEVIRKMGGWKQLCSMETKDEPFRKKDFIQAYSMYKKRGDDYQQNLVGFGTMENKVFIGFEPDDNIELLLENIKSGKKTETKVLEMYAQKLLEKK